MATQKSTSRGTLYVLSVAVWLVGLLENTSADILKVASKKIRIIGLT